jgi:hypothetical protein
MKAILITVGLKCYSVLYWQLVGWMKSLEQTAEKIIWSQKIIIILTILDYSSISSINIFSNGQFYYRRHHLFAATHTHSLSLSLCPPAITTFHWVSNPVESNKKYHWINTFHKELFSFLKVAPMRKFKWKSLWYLKVLLKMSF